MDNNNADSDDVGPIPSVSEFENDKSDEEEAIDELKTLLLPLVSRLKKAKKEKPNADEKWLWWFPIINVASGHNHLARSGNAKQRVASLASHIGITDEHFHELRKRSKLVKFIRWPKVLGFSVIRHKEGQTTWIASHNQKLVYFIFLGARFSQNFSKKSRCAFYKNI